MVIVVEFGLSVHEYCTQFVQLVFPRPDTCPHCAATNSYWGHGSYVRQVCDHEQERTIRVKRWLCSVCRHTVSLLPCFCLPFRHYQAATIERVLSLRFARAASWSAICQHFAPADLPVLTTCREWVQSFAANSARYLFHLLRQLAQWQLVPGALDLALSDIALVRHGVSLVRQGLAALSRQPQQLLAAVPHLAAWLKAQGWPQNKMTSLPLLNLWGSRASLGRLV